MLRQRTMSFKDYADQREDHASKSDDREIGRTFGSPPYSQPSEQYDEIEEPSDERPGLLGIPANIGSARKLGRDGSRHDSQREQRKPQHDRLLIEVIEKVERRELTIENVELFGLEESILDQVHHTRDKRNSKSHRAQHAERDVKPQGLEHGLECRLCIWKGRGRDQGNQGQGHHKGPKHMNPMTELNHQKDENDHPSEKGERFGKTGRCGW